MHAFDVLGDPVRRRVLELLAEADYSSGAIVDVVGKEFEISQSAVSQHLKVLRSHGFATVRIEGTRRVYALETGALQEVDNWLAGFRQFWTPKFEALATEVARGKRARTKSKIEPEKRK
ncbi:MAG: metalloregulator ArsR/SmtB family transcription factor, partial [Pseudomonadota bacterium]